MKKRIILALVAAFISLPVMANAHDDHEMAGMNHGDHAMAGMDPVKHGMMLGDNEMPADTEKSAPSGMGTSGAFLVTKKIDGYAVTFHVMKAGEGMKHGGTHNVMLKVERDGMIITDLTINSKVVHPNGKEETKPVMPMGDWFSAGYNLGHEGQHQLMALFKTSDGKKHFGGVHYPQ